MTKLSLALLVASLVAAHNGCEAFDGSSLSIISPAAGTSYTVGDQMDITWNQNNATPLFKSLSVNFDLANSTDPNNAVAVNGGALSPINSSNTTIPLSSGTVSVKIPAVASGSKYSVRATWRDASDPNNRWSDCFSPTFSIVNTNPAPAPSANVATVSQAPASPAATVKPSGGLVAVVSAFVTGLAAALTL